MEQLPVTTLFGHALTIKFCLILFPWLIIALGIAWILFCFYIKMFWIYPREEEDTGQIAPLKKSWKSIVRNHLILILIIWLFWSIFNFY